MNWLNALQEQLRQGKPCVVVTVAAVAGSAPRTIGSRMVVEKERSCDTIGGGALEYDAIAHAKKLLESSSDIAVIESREFVLGRELSQCCGGRVTLNFEYHPPRRFDMVVFGAGHVSQCVATLLKQLPCTARFYDSRHEWLKKLPTAGEGLGLLSTHVLTNNPFESVEECPDCAFYLIMTHSHELDFELTEAILARGDSTYCGLIASSSKATSFRSRLYRKGFTEQELAKLTAPIGADAKTGKLPMEVAIAAVQEVLRVRRLSMTQPAQRLADVTGV